MSNEAKALLMIQEENLCFQLNFFSSQPMSSILKVVYHPHTQQIGRDGMESDNCWR